MREDVYVVPPNRSVLFCCRCGSMATKVSPVYLAEVVCDNCADKDSGWSELRLTGDSVTFCTVHSHVFQLPIYHAAAQKHQCIVYSEIYRTDGLCSRYVQGMYEPVEQCTLLTKLHRRKPLLKQCSHGRCSAVATHCMGHCTLYCFRHRPKNAYALTKRGVKCALHSALTAGTSSIYHQPKDMIHGNLCDFGPHCIQVGKKVYLLDSRAGTYIQVPRRPGHIVGKRHGTTLRIYRK